MTHKVIVHLMNEDPFVAETERLPEADDVTISVSFPRRRDGKPLQYMTQGVTGMIVPMHRISFIEIIPEEKEEEEEIAFYRE